MANTFPEEIINISGKRALIATSTFSINIGPLFKEYQISAPIQTSKNLTVELILPVNFQFVGTYQLSSFSFFLFSSASEGVQLFSANIDQNTTFTLQEEIISIKQFIPSTGSINEGKKDFLGLRWLLRRTLVLYQTHLFLVIRLMQELCRDKLLLIYTSNYYII